MRTLPPRVARVKGSPTPFNPWVVGSSPTGPTRLTWDYVINRRPIILFVGQIVRLWAHCGHIGYRRTRDQPHHGLGGPAADGQTRGVRTCRS
jgi:hypothetical protein